MKLFILNIFYAVIGKVHSLTTRVLECSLNEQRLNMRKEKIDRDWKKRMARNPWNGYGKFIQGTTRCDHSKLLNAAIEERDAEKRQKNLTKARRQIEAYANNNKFRKLADVNGAEIIPSRSQLSKSQWGHLTRREVN